MPYLRGLTTELEGNIELIKFDQPRRKRERLKMIFYLNRYCNAWICETFKITLTFYDNFGLILSFISICISFVFLFYKIFFWDSLS